MNMKDLPADGSSLSGPGSDGIPLVQELIFVSDCLVDRALIETILISHLDHSKDIPSITIHK